MSVYDVVECPYCGYDHDLDGYEFDGSNEIDIECECCEKEFEVIRDWIPSYSSHSIEYTTCECCGKVARDSDTYIFGAKDLCLTCLDKHYIEWLKRSK